MVAITVDWNSTTNESVCAFTCIDGVTSIKARSIWENWGTPSDWPKRSHFQCEGRFRWSLDESLIQSEEWQHRFLLHSLDTIYILFSANVETRIELCMGYRSQSTSFDPCGRCFSHKEIMHTPMYRSVDWRGQPCGGLVNQWWCSWFIDFQRVYAFLQWFLQRRKTTIESDKCVIFFPIKIKTTISSKVNTILRNYSLIQSFPPPVNRSIIRERTSKMFNG